MTTLNPVLAQSENIIFYGKPASLRINVDARTDYISSKKIETLIAELKQKGPLLAFAQIGPSHYSTDPVKLKIKIGGQEIYSWSNQAIHRAFQKYSYVIVLGAKKSEGSNRVYFTMSEMISYTQALLTHQPLTTDTKVYSVPHTAFSKYLFEIHHAEDSYTAVGLKL
jgi:hypothetical protein